MADGPRTTHLFVRDSLREAIVRGDLKSGARLIQNELAEQYGVSTTPVREAMRDLATEGLIRFDAHRGAVVHEPDGQELEDIYEMRMLLEPHAIRKAAERITDEELQLAEAIQQRAEQEPDPGHWVDLNRKFHSVFFDATRSQRLVSILKQLRDTSAIYVGYVLQRSPDAMATGNHEHRELLDACRARDADRAEEIVRRHLMATKKAGEDSLAEERPKRPRRSSNGNTRSKTKRGS